MVMSREWYRPHSSKHARKEVHPGIPGSEIYRWINVQGKCVAMVFGGKRSKPDFHYCYVNEEQREARIKDWIDGQIARANRTKERAASSNAPHTLKVGDVLYASWGYDQTNASFWQVLEVPSKCFVVAQGIGSKTVSSEGSGTHVTPVKDSFKGEPKRYQVGPDNSIRAFSFARAGKAKWDGEYYETHWAYGH